MVIDKELADFFHIPRFKLETMSDTRVFHGKLQQKPVSVGLNVTEMMNYGNNID